MKVKIMYFVFLLAITISSIYAIVVSEINNYPVWSSLGGLVAGLTLPKLWEKLIDFTDNSNWKVSQRKLQRGKLINDETPIRISFAYLFRIKVSGKYFLVKNARNTGKYQPVGGVYKLNDVEASYLHEKFYAEDDNRIPVDESSKGDYRLRFKNKYLRRFLRRFNKTCNRESLENLSREFKEELLDTNILNINNFKILNYSYCGRHMTKLAYGEHFQCYELLLADVIHVDLTKEQEKEFENLKKVKSDNYIFASDEEIKCLGIDVSNNDLHETIADHTSKILIENDSVLISPRKLKKNKKYYCCI